MQRGILIHCSTVFRSQIFIWRSGQFRLDHTFDTQQAVDVEFIDLQTVQYLAVASGKSHTISLPRSQVLPHLLHTHHTLPLILHTASWVMAWDRARLNVLFQEYHVTMLTIVW